MLKEINFASFTAEGILPAFDANPKQIEARKATSSKPHTAQAGAAPEHSKMMIPGLVDVLRKGRGVPMITHEIE